MAKGRIRPFHGYLGRFWPVFGSQRQYSYNLIANNTKKLMKNLKTYKINLSNIKLVTNKHLCLSLLPSGILLLAALKSRYPILRSMFWVVIPIFQNQAVFTFLQNVFSLFFGENVGRKKVVFLKSKAILFFISFA